MAFLDHISDAQVRRVFCFWIARRPQGAMPLRRDINPMGLPPDCLPHLFMYRLEPGKRLRCVLIGTAIVRVVGHDETGRYLDELLRGSAAATRLRLFDRVVEDGYPLYYTGPAVLPTREARRVERLLLPLSSDGRICDHVFGIAKFGPVLHDHPEEPWASAADDPARIVIATDDDLSAPAPEQAASGPS